MIRKLFFSFVFVALFSFPFQSSQAKPPLCSPQARLAYRKMPKFKPTCGPQDEDLYRDETRKFDPKFQAELQRYLSKLEKSADDAWWSVSSKALQSCSKLLAKPTTFRRVEEYYDEIETFSESNGIRFYMLIDPCLAPRNSSPLDAFALVRHEGKTYASVVLDGFYTRAEIDGVSFGVEELGDEKLIIAEIWSGGMHSIMSYHAYRLNPQTHHAEPYPLFKSAAGEMSDNYSDPMPSAEEGDISFPTLLGKSDWKSPFKIFKFGGLDDQGNTIPKAENYLWEGKQFVLQGLAAKQAAYQKGLAKLRQCTQKLQSEPEQATRECRPQDYALECPYKNDLSWLYFKAKNFDQALQHAQMALSDCSGNIKESEAAAYNYRKIQKALTASVMNSNQKDEKRFQ